MTPTPGEIPSAPQAAPATVATAAPPLSLTPSIPSLALPLLALVALAAAALLLGRRRRGGPRIVDVVERTSLGPKRSLLLVRVGEELLLLGSSEAGISLLRAQPDDPARSEPAPRAGPAPAGERPASRVLSSIAAKLAPVRHPAPSAEEDFQDLLLESREDQDLRRKLAAGKAGLVR